MIQIETIASAIMALIFAFLAAWQKQKKEELKEEIAIEKDEKEAIIRFFDPDDKDIVFPPEPLPERTWKMSEETKRFLVAGHSPFTAAEILQQVEAAERAGKKSYYIKFRDTDKGKAGYYEIEYGLIKGSSTGPIEGS